MKAKRTLLSMAVFLLVYCLSIFLSIPHPSYRTPIANSSNHEINSIDYLNSNGVTAISSFTRENMDTNTLLNKYLLPMGDVVLQANSDTTNGENGSIPEASLQEIAKYDISNEENTYIGNELSISSIINDEEINPSSDIQSTSTEDLLIDHEVDQTDYMEDTKNTEEEPIQEESPYSNIGISIANNYVNIRKTKSTDSEVLGKLYRNSAVEILDTMNDWYYIVSGSVKGYVKAEFIKTGIPEDELIKKYGTLSISVNVNGLNVREKPDTDSKKLTVVYSRDTYPVIDVKEEWVKVNIKDKNIVGYVSKELVDIHVDFKDAVSKKEELEIQRTKEAEKVKKETTVKYGAGVKYTEEDLKLLVCLVHSEAGGQSYEGKLAVANVVLNRVRSSKFPSNIKSVIYSPGQFSVARSGILAKQLANYSSYKTRAHLTTIKAVRAALDGANNIGNRMYFNNYKVATAKGYSKLSTSVKIQDHLFW